MQLFEGAAQFGAQHVPELTEGEILVDQHLEKGRESTTEPLEW